nr:DUF3566 domain-containing protein [Gordonia araii]
MAKAAEQEAESLGADSAAEPKTGGRASGAARSTSRRSTARKSTGARSGAGRSSATKTKTASAEAAGGAPAAGNQPSGDSAGQSDSGGQSSGQPAAQQGNQSAAQGGKPAGQPDGQPGGGKPGVKPPWQRADELAPDTAGNGDVPPPPPRKKPIITGTAAPKLTEPAPEPGGGDRFVESPTRNTPPVKSKNLPNLDEIHVPAPGAAQRGGPSLGQRSAPTHVGAAGAVGARALRATVQIRRIDPWSTLKISAILSVIGFFIWMIAVAVLYLILEGMGVWAQLNSSVGTLTTDGGGADALGAGTVFGWAFMLGIVNAILLTALASVGAFIYNLCADFIGGVEVTLADLD